MIVIKDCRTEVGAKLAIEDVLSKAYDNVWNLAQGEIESDAELASATMTLTDWRG